MKINFRQNQLSEIITVHILPLLSFRKIFTFVGPLGVGKTTMIKEILRQCGIDQNITSPTFGYVNSYPSQGKILFNHFDLYRMTCVDEFIDAGFDEMLHKPDNICFIEWPEIIDDLLNLPNTKDKVCRIKMGYADNDFSERCFELI